MLRCLNDNFGTVTGMLGGLLFVLAAGTAAPSPSEPAAPPPPLPAGWTAPTPQTNPGSWMSANDYPSSALRNEEEGVVGFRLTVSKAGMVDGCVVVHSSGSVALDDATCHLMWARARLNPAKDDKGHAVDGTYSSTVRWKIPDDMPQPQAGSVVSSLIVEKDGHLTDCRFIRSDPWLTGAPPIGSFPCAPSVVSPPFTNAKGEPIRKRMVRTTTVTLEDVPD